jgi:hypothetical protein
LPICCIQVTSLPECRLYSLRFYQIDVEVCIPILLAVYTYKIGRVSEKLKSDRFPVHYSLERPMEGLVDDIAAMDGIRTGFTKAGAIQPVCKRLQIVP